MMSSNQASAPLARRFPIFLAAVLAATTAAPYSAATRAQPLQSEQAGLPER